MDLHHSGYVRSVVAPIPRRDAVKWAEEKLRPIANTFDAIAITGVSGTIGGILAYLLDKPLIVVRKGGASSHSHRMVELCQWPAIPNTDWNYKPTPGEVPIKTYLIIDDTAGSGATRRRMVAAIDKLNLGLECIGTMLHSDKCFQMGSYRHPQATL